jgi:hypothetical protein
MTLSPAAQAVLDAAVRKGVELAVRQGLRGSCRNAESNMKSEIAAALRAAAAATQMRQYGNCWICDADELLAIANELDAQP